MTRTGYRAREHRFLRGTFALGTADGNVLHAPADLLLQRLHRPDDVGGQLRGLRKDVSVRVHVHIRKLRSPHACSYADDGPSCPSRDSKLGDPVEHLGDAGDLRGKLRPLSGRQRRDPEQRDREFDFVCLGDIFDRRLRDAAEPGLSLGLRDVLWPFEWCASPGRKRRDPRVGRGRDRRLFCGVRILHVSRPRLDGDALCRLY